MTSLGKSDFGYEPNLALFERPSVNTGILSYKWVSYSSNTPISSTGLLDFTIDGASTCYVDLKHSYLQLQGQILKSDGTKTDVADDVSFINMPLQTMWCQVDLSLQKKINSAKIGTNYAYKAYLDVLLNSTSHQMTSQLTSQLFGKDTAGKMEETVNNTGHLIRKKFSSESKMLQMEAPLCLDLCQQNRLILNGVEISLKLWPNKAPFYISTVKTDENYQFKLSNATFMVCMAEISPAILIGHAAALKETPALYPYNQSDIKSYDISKGTRNFTKDNIFQGDVPSDVIIGLVSTEAYAGTYNKNPFNFQHFDCNYCGLFINSISTPSDPFSPNYEADEANSVAYTSPYLSLFGRKYDTTNEVPIPMGEYPNGYCLYKFQLNEGNDNDNHDFLSLPRRGNTRLSLRFKKSLPENVTLIIYAHFPRTLQIDESRNVYL